MPNKDKICIVYLSTYPPRECGIATFTRDLISYSDELFSGKVDTKVVAMKREGDSHDYPEKVLFQITQNNIGEYESAAEKINNMDDVDLICIQHEYGIFGVDHGEKLIHFLKKLKKPSTITLHTVLPVPDPKMKEVTLGIISHVSKLIVMTELSKKILLELYNAPAEKIEIIPHGIHPKLYSENTNAKKKLNLKDKFILTTFGLLSRGKGVEYGILAMPKIVERYPNTIYMILGETHPIVLQNEGEVYRNELITLAKKLGVEDHVVFVNKYFDTTELLFYLEATDVYLSLAQNPNQTVSGTLTYALGAGRPVISTAFMQATEVITPEVGVLVPFNNHESISHEVINLIEDKGRRINMGRGAYFHTRNITWSNIALHYMSVFSSLLPTFSTTNKYMLPIKIDHLVKMTDEFGVLQFAKLNEPDINWGYTLDDNARALVALAWFYKINPSNEIEGILKVLLSFIERAAKGEGGFINYFDGKREPHDELNRNENLEDANSRALWALALVSKSTIPDDLRKRAKKLFEAQFKLHKEVNSPRAAAFYIKAFSESYDSESANKTILNRVNKYALFLVDLFKRSSEGEWSWFEESLNYSNGVLPQSLIMAYKITKDPQYLEIAKKSLDFLVEHSFEGDICVPVGQAGWFKKGKAKQRYDQQPEEVAALVLALHHMFEVTKEEKYREKMLLAFDWFLGNNLSNQVVYTHLTGGSYDGISQGGVNLNQGAESTIAYLLARLTVERTTS